MLELRDVTVQFGGVKPLDGVTLAVAPGVTLTLQPRGYHLLLTGLGAPLILGARLPVTLVFEKAGSLAIELVVEEPGPIGQEVLVEERHRG